MRSSLLAHAAFVAHLFSLMYELDVGKVGDAFDFDDCRDIERMRLERKNSRW